MTFITDILKTPFICLGWIIVGAIAGAVAGSLTHSQQRGLIYHIILGWIGALVGGVIASLFDFAKPAGGLNLVVVNLIISIIGAVVVIVIWRAFSGRRVARP